MSISIQSSESLTGNISQDYTASALQSQENLRQIPQTQDTLTLSRDANQNRRSQKQKRAQFSDQSQEASYRSRSHASVSRETASSEAFVAASNPRFGQSSAKNSLSWKNGTYYSGRMTHSAYGISPHGETYVQGYSLEHAAKTYAAMASQGINSSLAPYGTGISLRV